MARKLQALPEAGQNSMNSPITFDMLSFFRKKSSLNRRFFYWFYPIFESINIL